jgi:teichuronic acid biosynthesis glycosyltransferase TuaC
MDQKLMVIGNSYYAGHKDWMNAIAGKFSQNYLFVKYSSISQYLKYVPIRYFQSLFRRNNLDVLIDQDSKPENLEIFPVDVNYLPVDSQFMNLGRKQSKRILETIRRRQLEFDLIHSHFIIPQGYSGVQVKNSYNVPLVVTAHGYDAYDLPFRNEEWRSMVESVLNQADHIITVSQNNLKCLQKLNIQTPITVLPNGFDAQKFYPRDMMESRNLLNLPPDKKIILMIGNFESGKGHLFLVSAIEKILREREDLLCILIGDGKIRKKIADEIEHRKLMPYFRFVGQTPHAQIPLWISASDMVVLPSLSEGNPYVMFETLGSGKPFLGTRVGGIPDIINSKDYGYVMEPGNPDDITQTIITALDRNWDPERIAQYAAQFTWDGIAQRTLEIYYRLLGG